MTELYCLPDQEHVAVRPRQTVLESLLNAGIPHAHACGGNGRCSTCRISIESGLENCATRSKVEQEMSKRLRLPAHVRLACQTHVRGDVVIRRMVIDDDDIDLAWSQIEAGSIGEEKLLAILFADIRGFTHLAEHMLPYDVIYILNRYFRAMDQVIRSYGGVINNYMGDGLMALFGLEEWEGAVTNAVLAGSKMLEEVVELNKKLMILQCHPLKIGIGIHFGPVVIGGIGHGDHPFITAIGDTVNIASRIEAANKKLETSMLVSEAVYQEVRQAVEISQSQEVSLPGRTGMFRLYEVIAIKQDRAPVFTQVVSQRNKKRRSWWHALKKWITNGWKWLMLGSKP